MIIQICEKCDRFYMVHNPNAVLKRCPNCKNEDLENIYGSDAHIWYLEGKLKVAKDQLALTEKALELACKWINDIQEMDSDCPIYADCFRVEKDCDSWDCRNCDCSKFAIEHFKTKAKEIINERNGEKFSTN